MNTEIIVIAGLPRSGTSLMMQMMDAAGVRCAGEWPDFEPEEIRNAPTPAFISSMSGGALKLLDPQRIELPPGFSYRIIFMSRSRRQQALSTCKFLRAIMVLHDSLPESKMREFEESLARDERQARAVLQAHKSPMMDLRFEDLIDRSSIAVRSVCDFLNLEDHYDAMRACIKPRSSRCLPTMLEEELIRP